MRSRHSRQTENTPRSLGTGRRNPFAGVRGAARRGGPGSGCSRRMGPKLALADEGRAGGAGQTIDQNSRETGAWQRAPAAVAAVRQERERPLSARETERVEVTWTAIFTEMGRRSAPAEEFENL